MYRHSRLGELINPGTFGGLILKKNVEGDSQELSTLQLVSTVSNYLWCLKWPGRVADYSYSLRRSVLNKSVLQPDTTLFFKISLVEKIP